MAKKNPYVTTIGFNKDDPDHVYVADFLNSMGRGKGQYIVKAIMAYQNPDGVTTGQMVVSAVDYEKIRAFVLQIVEEWTAVGNIAKMDKMSVSEHSDVQRTVQEGQSQTKGLELDENAVNDILASLSLFR